MSSRLVPPKVGSSDWADLDHLRQDCGADLNLEDIHADEAFEQDGLAFPSIRGHAASAPMSPKPRTAVPSVTSATRLPRPLYLKERAGSCGSPGRFSREKACGLSKTVRPFRPMVLKLEAFLSQLFLEQRIQHHGGGPGIFELADAVDFL
jgi:hypothetical protein